MKNSLEDLRNHLFAQLERLGDETAMPSKDELARARELREVASVLIDSARAEIEYMRVRNDMPRTSIATSKFIEGPKAVGVSNEHTN